MAVGGQLFVSGTPTIPNNFSIAGVGYPDSGGSRAGAIRANNGQTFTGSITLADDARIGFITTTASVTLSGQITGSKAIDFYGGLSGNSATHTFTLANTGTANNYSGNTSITSIDFSAARTGGQAILRLGASDQIPNGVGKGNVALSGTLDLNGTAQSVNGLNGSGTVDNVSGGGSSILTVGNNDVTSAFSGLVQNTSAGTVSIRARFDDDGVMRRLSTT